jgi:nitrate/TMAO reductase-like tetraheme cytochrome c subunit
MKKYFANKPIIISKKILLVLTIIISIFIGVGLATREVVHYTSSSGFCVTCHSMDKYYASWSKSAHKKIQCYDCHADAGISGMVKAKIGGLKEVYITAMGYQVSPQDITAYNRCAKCHVNLNKLQTKGVFKHNLHPPFNCSRCHENLVHGKEPQKNMAFCIKCHKKSQALGAPVEDCNKCHPVINKVRPASHENKKWKFITHVKAFKQSKKACLKCHTSGLEDEKCVKCHQLFEPHPKKWIGEHVSVLKVKGIKFCINCHSNNPIGTKDGPLCTNCHGYQMPHPKNWAKTHAKVGNQPKCSYCHSPTNPVNPEAKRASKTFCYDCHQKSRPHDAFWVFTHDTNLKKFNCVVCHSFQNFCQKCHTLKGNYSTFLK